MLDKSPAKIRRMFDAVSPKYDLLNRLFTLNQDIKWRAKTARLCPDRGLVLDLCSGTGDLVIKIIENTNCCIVCCDFSFHMLRLAKEKFKNHSPIPILQADTLSLPFTDSTFDACTVAFGLRNLKDINAGLYEINRVLKPGGIFLILEFSVPVRLPFGWLYMCYLNSLLPIIGDTFTLTPAYSYFARSIKQWYSRQEFEKLVQSCGFRLNHSTELLYGVAMIYRLVKIK